MDTVICLAMLMADAARSEPAGLFPFSHSRATNAHGAKRNHDWWRRKNAHLKLQIVTQLLGRI